MGAEIINNRKYLGKEDLDKIVEGMEPPPSYNVVYSPIFALMLEYGGELIVNHGYIQGCKDFAHTMMYKGKLFITTTKDFVHNFSSLLF